MRSIIIPLLVLLFSMRGAQTQNTQTEVQTESTGADAIQVDVYAELKELRDMVVEQRALLSVTQNEVETLRTKNSVQETELAVLKTRLAARTRSTQTEFQTESQSTGAADATTVVTTQLDNSAELAELRDTVENLSTTVEELRTTLSFTQTELQNTKSLLYTVQTRLAATETDVVNLEKEITEKPKVAFSAGLTNSGYLEAGNTELNLVFTKIITNVGQAYSSTTGFFTAPVRGVYYFRFTVMDYLTSRNVAVSILKNGEKIIQINDYDNDGRQSYLSSGVTLQLEVGDEVNTQLPAGYRLFDDVYNRSIFSGFLLFPLQ